MGFVTEMLKVNGRHGRFRCRQEDNIKIGLYGVNWIHLASDRDSCWPSVNTVVNLHVP
jgi:hypothetical protein